MREVPQMSDDSIFSSAEELRDGYCGLTRVSYTGNWIHCHFAFSPKLLHAAMQPHRNVDTYRDTCAGEMVKDLLSDVYSWDTSR